MVTLQEKILNCSECKTDELGFLLKHSPVYSFGNPENKIIIVIGLNPSTKEFEPPGYLHSGYSINERFIEQQTYFDRPYYSNFFGKIEPFFQGIIKERLEWKRKPWEKVGFLDLVKCPTRTYSGQWSSLKPKDQQKIIRNCENYLIKQINLYKPKILIGYGKSVCEWFKNSFSFEYKAPDSKKIVMEYEKDVLLILIYQKQGAQRHTNDEIEFVRTQILTYLN